MIFFAPLRPVRIARPGDSMKVGAGHRLYGKTHSEPV